MELNNSIKSILDSNILFRVWAIYLSSFCSYLKHQYQLQTQQTVNLSPQALQEMDQMESLAAFPDGEFDFFNRMSAIDEFNFTQQLHFYSFPLENDEGFSFINPSTFCHNPGAGFTDNGGLSHKFVDWSPPTIPDVIQDSGSDHCLGNVVLGSERKFNVLEFQAERDQTDRSSSENTKKRPRVLKDAQKVPNKALNSKKNRRINVDGNEGDSNINGLDGLISCSTTYSSGDDNVSQDTNNGVGTSDSKASGALNLNGKTRASRGAATDPQSLYARKRRERINERLRILQNLVPNGTKVDISTMLEEAVHYVKFLQLQIKLLSSDDLWMYAPIAYNGIDIDLDKKISKLL
ncbi:hypothetical protein V6N11_039185 [Hibiscus sabdariffa]|uniref:BHLH domain-containing protein n=1 Tax=Hibiscus sabdariffa TaxID=183260 RepID=A0ABR2SN21_9ROSI